MLVDSHAHLNFKDFNDDWQQVIANCQKEEIWVVNVGAQLATSKKAVAIASEYPKGVYAAIGLHPIHVAGGSFQPEEFAIEDYRALINSSKKVVAIGETGIDFYHSAKNFTKQKEIFLKHLDLAQEFGLPVVLHARNSKDGENNAYEEILKILNERLAIGNKRFAIKGVIHCFGGTVKQAQAFIELGFFIGFTGIITFAKTGELEKVVKSLALERILIETDSPYLAPTPYRGKRNLPQYVEYVARKIAEIRGIDYNEVKDQTVKNTKELFNL